MCAISVAHTFLFLEEIMDKTWLNDLRNKITKIRLMWLKYLSVNLVIMIVFWLLYATAPYGDNTKEVYFVIATILSF